MPLGKKVLIIGGDIQGCQLAEFLVERGRKVTVVEEDKELAKSMTMMTSHRVLPWLQEKGVTFLSDVKYEKITDKGLTIITREGKKEVIEADSIVLALPLRRNADFLTGLEGRVPEIYQVGDCRQSGLIIDAIADGSRIAREI